MSVLSLDPVISLRPLPSEVTIRQALPEDASSIVEMHMQAWRDTFKGIVPDALLDSLNSVEWCHNRCQQLESHFNGVNPQDTTWIATAHGRVVGLIDVGPVRSNFSDFAVDPKNTGEVKVFYISKDYHGTGVAQSLWCTAVKRMFELMDSKKFCVWTISQNLRAQHFYGKKLTGVEAGRVKKPFASDIYLQVCFFWEDGSMFVL
ncbi:acyl-CoA N-acyltransferase [Basidiobolus meristosporus CBS 931.73]|uniref:Acyl-CoA N-acyltransferase n=1 Tax=Basidiobolus meristosporus CBS 931.73 TaxID=1314790 RepID=A0A1Y1XW76_9FUNG|nr:acyl-CoA N-acyltransferase [Basidiobolus meristosporus CBS 931.73]|eukprot:ORX89999.1 acyl-CoA N-acyltransferase [Basidiobolus meristosporus CBS 931.73]